MTIDSSRRNFLTTMGGLTLGATQLSPLSSVQFAPSGTGTLNEPVKAIVIGHGSRGSLYSRYSGRIPDLWKIVGVAEPIEYRRESAVQAYKIPSNQTFKTWEDVFQKPKF